MGRVYEVSHAELPRRFALKMLRENLAGKEEARRRFRREAEVGALLVSPHLVSVIDSQLDAPMPCFVMEYLDGEDVRSLLRRAGRVSPSTALEIVAGACEGLRVAHEARIVHRDLKPANLFVCAGQRCKVLDFGVAKIASEAELPVEHVESVTGHRVGTLVYMAPEQIRGDRSVDGRADIYALGVILYELISGVRPHEGEGEHEVMYRILHESPRPLSEVCATCPREVSELVAAAMAKEPARRFATIESFAQRLAHTRATLGGDGESGTLSAMAHSFLPARRSRGRILWTAACASAFLGLAFLSREGPAASEVASRKREWTAGPTRGESVSAPSGPVSAADVAGPSPAPPIQSAHAPTAPSAPSSQKASNTAQQPRPRRPPELQAPLEVERRNPYR